MRVKLFTFRYSATLGGFDDSVLQDFVRDKEVVAVRSQARSFPQPRSRKARPSRQVAAERNVPDSRPPDIPLV